MFLFFYAVLQSRPNKLVFDLPLLPVFPCTPVCQLKFSVKTAAITIGNAFIAIVSSTLASSSDLVPRSYVTQLVYIVSSAFFRQIDR